jgi:hypothetical protein
MGEKLGRKKNHRDIVLPLPYAEFNKTLQEEIEKYSGGFIAKRLQELALQFENLSSFANAFTSMVQAGPRAVGLLWGVLHIVLVVSIIAAMNNFASI